MAQKASGHLRLCPDPRNATNKVRAGALLLLEAAKADTTESLALLRERWQKKGSRKCLHFWEEEQQAKRACFEYFKSSRTSAGCDDVTERG